MSEPLWGSKLNALAHAKNCFNQSITGEFFPKPYCLVISDDDIMGCQAKCFEI